MYQTATRTLDQLKSIILAWPDIEAVTRLPFPPKGQDLPPTLKLDVYFRGSLPAESTREQSFSPSRFFESSRARAKDRFLLEDLPVHIDYKAVTKMETLTRELLDQGSSSLESSTYGLYRIARGIPLAESTPWLTQRRDDLSRLPGVFWTNHRKNLESRIEHLIVDMGQGELMGNDYAWIQAYSAFLEAFIELLFTINREFLPSQEMVSSEILGLEVLPSGFSAAFDLLLREGGLDRERKRELAMKTFSQLLRL